MSLIWHKPSKDISSQNKIWSWGLNLPPPPIPPSLSLSYHPLPHSLLPRFCLWALGHSPIFSDGSPHFLQVTSWVTLSVRPCPAWLPRHLALSVPHAALWGVGLTSISSRLLTGGFCFPNPHPELLEAVFALTCLHAVQRSVSSPC